MSSTMIKGRTIAFDDAPHNGTFPGSHTYVNLCVSTFPDVGNRSSELDVTDSCSVGDSKEYIFGLADGDEWQIEANFKGSDGTDFGIATGTLLYLAQQKAIVGIKDSLVQTALSADLIARYDVQLLGWQIGGGAVGDIQKIRVMGRITGTIDLKAS